MPECHNCPNNGKRRKACLTCSGPSESLSHDGQIICSLDSALAQGVQFQAPEPQDQDAGVSDSARQLMLRLYSLPDSVAREIVIRRMCGDSYATIAASLTLVFHRHFTTQAVHGRLHAIVHDARWAHVRAGFQEMIAKTHRRQHVSSATNWRRDTERSRRTIRGQ